MSFNILKQVMEELAATPFPISTQLDKSTGVSQCSQILVFVRYGNVDAIKDEFLFYEPPLETTNDFLKILDRLTIDWKKKLCSLCTHGAPVMLGNTTGFAVLVKKRDSSGYGYSLFPTSTCIGIKDSANRSERTLVY